jgi:hypothetical protein
VTDSTTTDYSDAPMILRESRKREAGIALDLAVELAWSSEFVAEDCLGDGFFSHPLLAAPGAWRAQSVSVTLTGEIVNGRGVHSQATFGVRESR